MFSFVFYYFGFNSGTPEQTHTKEDLNFFTNKAFLNSTLPPKKNHTRTHTNIGSNVIDEKEGEMNKDFRKIPF